MMKKLTTIIVATGLGLASGCAMSPNSYQYKADHSRAYNLAQAQGEIVNILLKIKNSFLPTKQILIGL